MQTNDILRRVRYALNIPDIRMLEYIRLTGTEISPVELRSMLSKEDDPDFSLCSDAAAHRFFAGLILGLRGVQEGKTPEPIRTDLLTANDVLWYLRIALQLRDDTIIDLLKKGGMEFSKSEIASLFRKKGHPNYRPCGDQLLRNFLVGLATLNQADL